MQAQAAEFPGSAENFAAFWRKSLKTVCFDSFTLEHGPGLKSTCEMAPRQILLAGLGNDYRGDDAVGLVVARRLKAIGGDNVRVVEESGEGATLIEAWKGADLVILIDAVHSGGVAGTIHRFDAETQPIPSRFFHYSTHAFSVAEAVELARALDQLPAKLIVYGIEGKTFDSGIGLSAEAEAAADEVLRRVREEVPRKSHTP
jgi:hydrogenase maturation protease